MKFVLGVDEAGRGPLAGPVAVGIVGAPEGFDIAAEFPGVDDSKQLTEKARERIFELLSERAKKEDVRFSVEFGSHGDIDEKGITSVVRSAVETGVRRLAPDASGIHIYLDGLLHAPIEYEQETVIHGDALIPIISLASIAAKVMRDRLMTELADTYPLYGFEKHKGYGTRLHYDRLKENGPCEIHRRSYLHLSESV